MVGWNFVVRSFVMDNWCSMMHNWSFVVDWSCDSVMRGLVLSENCCVMLNGGSVMDWDLSMVNWGGMVHWSLVDNCGGVVRSSQSVMKDW